MADLSGLHVLIVPSWWPSAEEPIRGVFFTDYARAFAAAGAKIGVVFPDLVSLRMFGKRRRVGHGPTCYSRPTPLRAKVFLEDLEGVPVVRVRGLHSAFGRIGRQMEAYRRWLARGLAAYRERIGEPDVVLAFVAIPAGWACTHLNDRPALDPSRIGQGLASRVVLSEHTGPFGRVMTPARGETYVRAAMARAAKVVTVSEMSRTEIQSFGMDQDIDVCGNPVGDVFTTRPVSARRGERPMRALFVGRLVREKGVEELVAAALMLGREPDIEWHWVGDGPLAGSVRDRFRRVGLADRLRVHGLLGRTQVAEVMAASDFLVLPSHGETFGQVVAEALCMGLPVVTTRGTACEEFVDAGSGVLVEIGSAASLVAGLRQLVGRMSSYDHAAIAERARRRFSGSAVAGKYAEMFRAVCEAT